MSPQPFDRRTIRVLLSSTFGDMQAERGHLVKVVFPALRERLTPHRLDAIEIDLRWGITKEESDNERVLSLCLEQIDHCDIFLGLLGERYGSAPNRFTDEVLSRYPWVQDHQGKSYTELEILHGVLNETSGDRPALFYFRDPNALTGMPEDALLAHRDRDPDAAAKLRDLKQRVEARCPHRAIYGARWDNDLYETATRTRGKLTDLEAFGERALSDLWSAIRSLRQLPEIPVSTRPNDPWAEEDEAHEHFLESRLRSYFVSSTLRQELMKYVESDAQAPCVVTGPPGAGKSSALAWLVQERRSRTASRHDIVVPHFVGAGLRSSSSRDLLHRLCASISARLGLGGPIPEEAPKLAIALKHLFTQAPEDARILLAIDAVDKLEEADRARELEWLPKVLPPSVKIVISCSSDEVSEPVLNVVRSRGIPELAVSPLNDDQRLGILQTVPSIAAKRLDDRQKQLLLANPASNNPLFLIVALEELRGFGSYPLLEQRIKEFPRGENAAPALFQQVLERLEQDFDEEMVRRVLSGLASARQGLAEPELRDLTADQEGRALLFPILLQLRPYLFRRSGLLDFHHQQLAEAARSRYLDRDDKMRFAHTLLADFFEGQPSWLDDHWPNRRKSSELPWQCQRAGRRDHLHRLLADFDFIEAKCASSLVRDLLSDYEAAQTAAEACDKDRSDEEPAWRKWKRWLESEAHHLEMTWAEFPQLFFQQAFNQPEGSITANAARERLAQRTRPVRPFAEWANPPSSAAASPLRQTWDGHQNFVDDIIATSDGIAISASQDATLQVRRADTGERLRVLAGHEDAVTRAVSAGPGRAASIARDGSLRLWDYRTGACLRTITDICGAPSYGALLAITDDGRRAIAKIQEDTLGVWDLETGRLLAKLEGHQAPITSLALLSGDRALTGSYDETIRLWDTKSGRCLASRRIAWKAALVVPTPNERWALCATTRGQIFVLEIDANLTETTVWEGHTSETRSIVCFPNSSRAVSASCDNSLRVWEIGSGACLARLDGHGERVIQVGLLSGDRAVSISDLDETMRIWDLNAYRQTASIPGRSFRRFAILKNDRLLCASGHRQIEVWDLSPDSLAALSQVPKRHAGGALRLVEAGPNRLLSVGWDQRIRLWDRASGAHLAAFRGFDTHSVVFAAVVDDLAIFQTFRRVIEIWDLRSLTRRAKVPLQSDHDLEFHPLTKDGLWIVDVGAASLKIWSAMTGRLAEEAANPSVKASQWLERRRRVDEPALSSTRRPQPFIGNAGVINGIIWDFRGSEIRNAFYPGRFEQIVGDPERDEAYAFDENGLLHVLRLRRSQSSTAP